MKIKWQLVIFFGVMLTLTAALAFLYFKEKPLLLLAAEIGLMILSVVFAGLLKGITRPIDQLAAGIDSLNDQDFSGFMRPTGSREINRLVEVYNRMLENIRKEKVFQQEQHFFLQNLIESLPVGLLILDFDNRLKEYNPVARHMLGIAKEHLGKRPDESGILPGPAFRNLELQSSGMLKTGGTRYIRVYTDRFRYRGFYHRFVILEEAGDEILEVERQSYGKVIRMMAHEVKNTVGAVNSILETLSGDTDLSDGEKKEYLGIVMERNRRLNIFMDNFAGVVRLPVPKMESFDVTETVRAVSNLFRLKHEKSGTGFSLTAPDQPVMLKGSREQMEQALINILLNSFEAIEGEGSVAIALTDSGITVTDTGRGIDEDTREKLFTPFFSTKPTGQGVGLTMVREILHHHRFPFRLYSENGLTRFEIGFHY